MSDEIVARIGENSPEQVAYKLYQDVMGCEQNEPRNRAYILDLYAECLKTVRGVRPVAKPSGTPATHRRFAT